MADARASLRVAVVAGTRPEVIKMAPVVRALAAGGLEPLVVSAGQHQELLEQAFLAVGIEPEVSLRAMTVAQTPTDLLARLLGLLSATFRETRPAAVLAQGDTTTVLAATLAAYYERIPVGHVEAGLRTYDHDHPFPEEGNRQLVDRLCRWCFAPTTLSAENLRREAIDDRAILVTGNTAVDGLLWAKERSTFALPPSSVLLTLHRRESFGGALDDIVAGVVDFLEQEPTALVCWPVHPNPAVRQTAERLRSHPRVTLTEPMDYLTFAGALATCRFVLSDSGGVQEEAPSVGRRVLVARETTERPEGVEAGTSILVGRGRAAVTAAMRLEFHRALAQRVAVNPFGDGHASQRIVAALRAALIPVEHA